MRHGAFVIVGDSHGHGARRLCLVEHVYRVLGHTRLRHDYHAGILHIHLGVVHGVKRGVEFANLYSRHERTQEGKYSGGVIGSAARQRNEFYDAPFLYRFGDLCRNGTAGIYRAFYHLRFGEYLLLH